MANPAITIPRGQIIPVPNMRVPEQGSQALAFTIDHTTQGTLDGDLAAAFNSGNFDFVQSVFIDNSQNAATYNLTILGVGSKGQVIVAQPFTQGYYPVSPQQGDGRFTSNTSTGQVIPVIFYNCPMPYFVWGPLPGVLVVPALTNLPLEFASLAIGDNILIPGALGKTIKVYRLLLDLGGGANVKFFDGASAGLVNLSGTMTMFAGGSITLQPSGVPWLTTSPGNGLIMTSSAAVNAGGLIGFTQT